MRRLRFAVRNSNASPDGRRVHSYGVRVGYWPCINAPFISLSVAIWTVELWHGLASYRHTPTDPEKS